MAKIVSVDYIGEKQTFDLEVAHPDHQFYLANGLLTSNSHATAYSILSYQSAYLLTKHQDEWITSFIDYCATAKGKLTGKEDPKSVAIREAMKLGYKLGKPDLNWSGLNYDVKKDKEGQWLIPSFLSLKGIGNAAAAEVIHLRKDGEAYDDVYSLFMKKNGEWKHSKFNKGALESLIQIEALESMGLVGEDKMFKNYKQLHFVAIENFDVIKRFFARKKTTSQDVIAKIDELVAESQSIEDWSREEKKDFQLEIVGQYDISQTYDPEVFEQLEKNGIPSIDDIFESKSSKAAMCWFFVQKSQVATTKTKKTYIKITAVGGQNQQYTIFFWNASITEKALPREGDLMVSTLKKGDWGFSSNDSITSCVVSRKVSVV